MKSFIQFPQWIVVLTALMLTFNIQAKPVRIGGNLGARQFVFDPRHSTERNETTIPGINDEEGLLLTSVVEKIDSAPARKKICDQLFVGAGDALAGQKVTVYDTRLGDGCESGGPFSMTAESEGESLKLKYVATDNLMTFHTTTPTFLSRGDDPRFRLTYDIQVVIELHIPKDLTRLPPGSDILSIRSAELTLTNANLALVEGEAGELLKGFVDAMARGFAAKANRSLQNGFGEMAVDISRELKPMLTARNQALWFLVSLNRFDGLYARVAANEMVGQTKGSVLLIFEKNLVILPSGMGTVVARVIWNRADGEWIYPSQCESLRFNVLGQAAPQQEETFTFRVVSYGKLRSASEISELPEGKIGCEFVVSGLPTEFPLEPQVSSVLPSGWRGASYPAGDVSAIYGAPVNFTSPVVLSSDTTVIRPGRGRERGPNTSAALGATTIEMTLVFNRRPR